MLFKISKWLKEAAIILRFIIPSSKIFSFLEMNIKKKLFSFRCQNSQSLFLSLFSARLLPSLKISAKISAAAVSAVLKRSTRFKVFRVEDSLKMSKQLGKPQFKWRRGLELRKQKTFVSKSYSKRNKVLHFFASNNSLQGLRLLKLIEELLSKPELA